MFLHGLQIPHQGSTLLLLLPPALLARNIVLVAFATYGVKYASLANIRGPSTAIYPTIVPTSMPPTVSALLDIYKHSLGRPL